MAFRRFPVALVAAAAVLLAPVRAQAQISTYTSLAAYLAAVTAPGTDTFSDISVAGSTSSPLLRTAGIYSYRASVIPMEGDPSAASFFGAGTAGNPSLSTNSYVDKIVFDQFSSTVRGIGGFFYGTDVFGGFLGNASVTLTAETADGFSQSLLFTPSSSTGFYGFVSSGGAFLSLSVIAVQSSAEDFVFPTVDNLVLGSASAPITAVPEPQTYAMLAIGLAAVGFVRRKRTA